MRRGRLIAQHFVGAVAIFSQKQRKFGILDVGDLKYALMVTFLSFIPHEKMLLLRVSLAMWVPWRLAKALHLRVIDRHQVPEVHFRPAAGIAQIPIAGNLGEDEM